MWSIATEIFLGTSLFFFEPIQIQTDYKQLISWNYFERNSLESLADRQSLETQARNLIPQLILDRNPISDRSILNDIYAITSNNFDNNSYQLKDLATERSILLAGTASWKAKTEFDLLALDGFDPQAYFTQGKALWEIDTDIGLVDLAAKLNQRIEVVEIPTNWLADTAFSLLTAASNSNQNISFIDGNAIWNADTAIGNLKISGKLDENISLVNSNAIWNANTALGAIALRGNFGDRTQFTGGNASWNANTGVGSLGFKGNFNYNADFIGGDIKVTTNALIGFFDADIKIDGETKLKSANASWNANLLFGSNIAVNGSFDETKSFTGGNIEFGAKSSLGIVGIKANLDRNTHLTSGSAFWKTETEWGSINFDADFKRNGKFESQLNIEFTF